MKVYLVKDLNYVPFIRQVTFIPNDSVCSFVLDKQLNVSVCEGWEDNEDSKFLQELNTRHGINVTLEVPDEICTQVLGLTVSSNLFSEVVERFGNGLWLKAEFNIVDKSQGGGHPITIASEELYVKKIGTAYQFKDANVYLTDEAWETIRFGTLQAKLKIMFSTQPGNDPYDKFEVNRKILNEGIGTDATLVASNGVEFKCHKSFLMVQSSMFRAMLESGMKEADTSVIEMSTVSEPVVKSLLGYLYYWELHDARTNSEMAVELFKTADYYNIRRLVTDVREILLTKPANWFSVNGGLDLYLLSSRLGMSELKLKALQVLEMKSTELMSSLSYQELFKKDPVSAMELCQSAFSLNSLKKAANANSPNPETNLKPTWRAPVMQVRRRVCSSRRTVSSLCPTTNDPDEDPSRGRGSKKKRQDT